MKLSILHPRGGSVLLIDEKSSHQHIATCLQEEGYQVHSESDPRLGLSYWRKELPELVICDLFGGCSGGLSVLQEIVESQSETQVIMISNAGEMGGVVEALRMGAADCLMEPLTDPEVLLHAVKRAYEEHLLSRENRLYREALEAKNRELADSLRLLKEDQEAGHAVQQKMLPAPSKRFGPVAVEYRLIPSLYLSGDFVDYFSLGKNRSGFYLADVSGHGASSAFVTVLLKIMANRVRQRFRSGEEEGLLPAEILHQANRELLPLGLGKHLAIFCGYIDLLSNKLVYCSAAHFPPPILVTEGKAITLEGRGLPVGLFEEVEYKNQQVRLGGPFSLVLFSDGILEVMPQQSVAEKEQYLVEIVSNGIHNVSQLCEHLRLDSYDSVPDDIALMTVSCPEL